MKKLLLAFYEEMICFLQSNPPRYYIVDNFRCDKRNEKEFAVINHKVPSLDLLGYYEENKKRISDMDSYKAIIQEVYQNKQILESLSSKFSKPTEMDYWTYETVDMWFGRKIIAIVEEMIEIDYSKESRIRLNAVYIKRSIEEFAFTETDFWEVLEWRQGNPWKNDYSFIIIKNLLLTDGVRSSVDMGDFSLTLRLPNQEETDAILNSKYYHENGLNNYTSIIAIEGILDARERLAVCVGMMTSLRLFKEGDFRLSAIGEMMTNKISGRRMARINSYASVVESESFNKIEEGGIGCAKIESHTAEDIMNYFKANHEQIGSEIYSYAEECMSIMHRLNHKNRIPLVISIAESILPLSEPEIGKKFAFYISCILERDDDFRSRMKKFYDLRSKLTHAAFSDAEEKMSDLGYNKNYEKAYAEIYSVVKSVLRKMIEDKMSSDNVMQLYKYTKEPAESQPH